MIFMLDFHETWLSTVERRLGILDIEGEGVQDVATADAVCLFDISVELVCEVNDPPTKLLLRSLASLTLWPPLTSLSTCSTTSMRR